MTGFTFRRQSFYILLYFLTAFWFAGCSSHSNKKTNGSAGSEEIFIFEDSVKVSFAKGFEVSYHNNYKLLQILNPYQDRTDTLKYVLKPRNVEIDTSISGAQTIEIPIRSMIATSTTHVALTEMLEANKIITGMVSAEYVYSEDIRNRLEEGTITSFPQGEFNKEQALAMGPDLIMVSAGQSSQFDDFKVLLESGINVLVNSEWLETTPLGKAEWVKMMAVLLNKEQEANEAFSEVADRYLSLKKRARESEKKPLIINNLPYKGAWFVSGGHSFTAQYLKDAGADYPWYDNTATGGLRKDYEVVYEAGLRADVWLNPGAATSKEEILSKDQRFKDFKSFKNGRIFNNNKRMSPSGGNDFWESGVVHPERLLADLIYIFHPEIMPDHELYYYQELSEDE